MKKLRVIQWTTGKIGKKSLQAIFDDPRLELVGVYAHSQEKIGVDAGQLCGRPDIGIRATNDITALIALKADSIVYTPFMADMNHVTRLLENGMDVISTNMFLNVGGIQGAVREQLEVACKKGNSSIYLTGVNPGWINSIATAVTAICRQVDSVAMFESANCVVYESVETWRGIGMGVSGATAELIETARAWLICFRDAVVRVGDALDLKFQDIEFFCEYATAAEDIDLGWFFMKKGTNAALRGGWNGIVDGRARIQAKVTWYLTKKLAEGWEIDDEQYHLEIKGQPGVDVRIRCVPGAHWTNADWDILTALPAVSALPDIKAAPAGILGLKDVGLPRAPVGYWKSM